MIQVFVLKQRPLMGIETFSTQKILLKKFTQTKPWEPIVTNNRFLLTTSVIGSRTRMLRVQKLLLNLFKYFILQEPNQRSAPMKSLRFIQSYIL